MAYRHEISRRLFLPITYVLMDDEGTYHCCKCAMLQVVIANYGIVRIQHGRITLFDKNEFMAYIKVGKSKGLGTWQIYIQ